MTENKRYKLSNIPLNNPFAIYDNGEALTQNEVIDKLNEQDKELENSKKQLKRVYNYFMDYLEDEMSSESFSEMWDFVITDEKWD